jgi:predicted phage tail protein
MPDFDDENKRLELSGSGGGGKSGGDRKPKEEDDDLFSKATARVLIALCEGEIEGFAEADEKSVYLNDTPIEEPNGVKNFDGNVDIVSTNGTLIQDALKGFKDVLIEQTVGVKVTKRGGGVSVTTSTVNLDEVIVRVGVGALYQVDDDNGDISGSKVKYNIRILDNNGTQISSQNEVIEGKTRSAFDTEHKYGLSGTGPWTVRVTRETDDAESATDASDFFFKAIVGVLDESFKYPGTALVGVVLDSEGFNQIPRLSVDLEGLLIQVPENYNTRTRNYVGTWNGAFKTRYSNNPAWVFYDLITNERYGCGQFIDADQVDKFALYEIAKYCDEEVNDGRGGKEPRFTFNGYINNRGEAYEVLNSIAAAFRGMLYYANGTVVPTQDRPGSVVKKFSASNVIQEVDDNGNVTTPPFSYEGTGRKARKTVALVSWNDPDDRYRTKLEYVEDRRGIDLYGYRELEVRAFGCTSQGQAQRMGRWALVTNLTEKETVTFRVTAQGFFMMPGEIIEVVDEAKTAQVFAGVVQEGSTSTNVKVDKLPAFVGGKSYEVTIRTETKPVNTVQSIASNAIVVTSGFGVVPAAGELFIVKEVGGAKPRKYRVMGIMELEDGTVTINATAYNEDKYNSVDVDTFFDAQIKSVAGVKVAPTVFKGSIVLRTS